MTFYGLLHITFYGSLMIYDKNKEGESFGFHPLIYRTTNYYSSFLAASAAKSITFLRFA